MRVTHENRNSSSAYRFESQAKTSGMLRSFKIRRMNLRRLAANLERGLIPDVAKY